MSCFDCLALKWLLGRFWRRSAAPTARLTLQEINLAGTL